MRYAYVNEQVPSSVDGQISLGVFAILAKMETRDRDTSLKLISESPGVEHLSIKGSRLPTYRQVLLCHRANMNKLMMDGAVSSVDVSFYATRIVLNEVFLYK